MPGFETYTDLTEAGVTDLTLVTSVVRDAQSTPATKEITYAEERKLFFRYASADPAREFKGVTLTGGTVTVSTPIVNATQTWNDGAITFNAFTLDVTDTASAATNNSGTGPMLMKLTKGGVSQFLVGKDGQVYSSREGTFGQCTYAYTGASNTGIGIAAGNVNIQIGGGTYLQISTTTIEAGADTAFCWSSAAAAHNGTPDTFLYRGGAANIISQRNSTSPQVFRIFNTYTTSTNNEYLDLAWDTNVAEIGTVKGTGGGTARALAFKTDDVNRMTIGAAGGVTIDGGTVTAAAAPLTINQTWNNGAVQFFGQVINITNTASLSTSRMFDLQIGGSTVFNITTAGTITTNGGLALVTGINIRQAAAYVTFGASDDAYIIRDAADSLAMRRSAAAQLFSFYNTYTSSTNYERGVCDWKTTANVFRVGTEKGSGGGTARDMVLVTDGAERMRIPATSGAIAISGNQIGISTSQTPASAGATGTTGTICWDTGFLYVCTATNTWKRVAIATW